MFVDPEFVLTGVKKPRGRHNLLGPGPQGPQGVVVLVSVYRVAGETEQAVVLGKQSSLGGWSSLTVRYLSHP